VRDLVTIGIEHVGGLRYDDLVDSRILLDLFNLLLDSSIIPMDKYINLLMINLP